MKGRFRSGALHTHVLLVIFALAASIFLGVSQARSEGGLPGADPPSTSPQDPRPDPAQDVPGKAPASEDESFLNKVPLLNKIPGVKKLPSLRKLPSYALDNIRNAKNYSLEVQAGAQTSQWKPAYGDTKDDRYGTTVRLVDYHAAGLQSYQIDGRLMFMNQPFLRYHYEAPWQGTPSQREMVEIKRRSRSGLEKFAGGIKLDPLAKATGLDDYRIGRFALSLQFVHTRERFFGSARTRRDCYYIPGSSTLDDRFIPSEITPLQAGQELDFKTTFVDDEYSIDVLKLLERPSLLGRSDIELRVGWFNTTWKRPTDTNTNFTYLDGSVWYVPLFNDRSTPGSRLLLDTTFTSTGYAISLGTTDFGAPGIQGNVFLRSGRENHITNSLESAPSTTFANLHSSDVSYSDVGANLLYNCYFGDGMFGVSLGGGVRSRMMAIPYTDADRARLSDTELLWKGFVNFTIRIKASATAR